MTPEAPPVSGAAPQPAPAPSAAPVPRSRRLADVFSEVRDALVGNPGFQRWCSRHWPFRLIARRRAAELFDLVAGFVYSQVLSALIELDLLRRLRAGPASVSELAALLDVPAPALACLLDAAVSLRLCERRGDQGVGLGPLGAALAGNEGLHALVRHHRILYADLAEPLSLLRRGQGRLAALWPYAIASDGAPAPTIPDEDVQAYSALMTASLPLVADDVLDAYSFRRHRRLLDIGGGEGGFALAAVRRHPQLEAVVADLPAVALRARRRVAEAGLSHRVEALGVDFLNAALPRAFDLATCVRVAHDQDETGVRRLFRAAWEALDPGGILIVAEPLSDAGGSGRMGDAYLGLYLLAMGRGRPRSAIELSRLLREAGFSAVHQRRTNVPLQTGLLVARK